SVVQEGAAILAGDHAERNGNRDCNQHRCDGEFDCCRIPLEDQADYRLICAKSLAEVAMKNRDPVSVVAIIQAIPAKMTLTVRILGKTKEERRAIQAVLRAKLG